MAGYIFLGVIIILILMCIFSKEKLPSGGNNFHINEHPSSPRPDPPKPFGKKNL